MLKFIVISITTYIGFSLWNHTLWFVKDRFHHDCSFGQFTVIRWWLCCRYISIKYYNHLILHNTIPPLLYIYHISESLGTAAMVKSSSYWYNMRFHRLKTRQAR